MSHGGGGAGMYEGPFDDRTPGAYPDAVPPVEMPSDLQEMPPAMPSDISEDFGPDWPPEVVPVAFWPEDVLRRALQEAPGKRLARVVAEAVDVDGNLEIGMPVAAGPDLDPDPGAGTGPAAGGGAGVGFSALAELSDEALADVVVACGRLQSWVAGVQARVVAERAGR